MKYSIIAFICINSLVALGQSTDTLKIKDQLQGEWEVQYYLDEFGNKYYLSLSFENDEVDSLKIIQRIAFDENQLKLTEWIKKTPNDRLELNGVWFFGDLPDVTSIVLKSPHFFIDGVYEVKSISNNQLILYQSSREEDIEWYFVKK
jgi:hypothetical protein